MLYHHLLFFLYFPLISALPHLWTQDDDTLPLSLQPESITFKITNNASDGTLVIKTYSSPIGKDFRRYYLPGPPVTKMLGEVVPITVIHVEGQLTWSKLWEEVGNFEAIDDVYDDTFLENIILQTSTSYTLPEEDDHFFSTRIFYIPSTPSGGTQDSFATQHPFITPNASLQTPLIPPGPYLLHMKHRPFLTEVYRLFPDTQQAFVNTLIPTNHGTYKSFSISASGDSIGAMGSLSIAVPSRLYTHPRYLMRPARELEGVRVAVKDIFDIAGDKTGAGSRAYWDSYGPRETSAYPIRKLIDLGAIIVGKTKTAPFALSNEDPLDQVEPLNVRGDGNQPPGFSSMGSGAAISAYDWLDVTIGSDTGSSVRNPAIVNGVYGYRPTLDAISLQGVVPFLPSRDTAGYLTRDPRFCARVGKAWYEPSILRPYKWFPKVLFVPRNEWNFTNQPAYLDTTSLESFKTALIDFLGDVQVDHRSFDTFWEESHSMNRSDYLLSYLPKQCYYQRHNFGIPWLEDFKSTHDGRHPILSKDVIDAWETGRNTTEEEYDESLRRHTTYQHFVEREVLRKDPETCSSALYLLPNIFIPGPRTPYKLSPKSPWWRAKELQYTSFAELPELVIPVGQFSYNSSVTARQEMSPLSVSIIAAKGCDGVLHDLTEQLQNGGIISAVKTGREAY